jgi:hypothetical protein
VAMARAGQAFTRSMNFAKPASCWATSFLVISSLSSSVFSSNLVGAWPTKRSPAFRMSERATGSRLDRHRVLLERLIREPRHPVDGVLERTRNAVVVLRRDDDNGIRRPDRIRQRSHVGRKSLCLKVGVIKREAAERWRFGQFHIGRCQRRQRIHQRTIEGAFAQAAADHKHITHMHAFPCCSPSRMRRAGWRGSGWRTSFRRRA